MGPLFFAVEIEERHPESYSNADRDTHPDKPILVLYPAIAAGE